MIYKHSINYYYLFIYGIKFQESLRKFRINNNDIYDTREAQQYRAIIKSFSILRTLLLTTIDFLIMHLFLTHIKTSSSRFSI